MRFAVHELMVHDYHLPRLRTRCGGSTAGSMKFKFGSSFGSSFGWHFGNKITSGRVSYFSSTAGSRVVVL